MVAVLQYITIIKIGAQRPQRSLFAQPNLDSVKFFENAHCDQVNNFPIINDDQSIFSDVSKRIKLVISLFFFSNAKMIFEIKSLGRNKKVFKNLNN